MVSLLFLKQGILTVKYQHGGGRCLSTKSNGENYGTKREICFKIGYIDSTYTTTERFCNKWGHDKQELEILP